MCVLLFLRSSLDTPHLGGFLPPVNRPSCLDTAHRTSSSLYLDTELEFTFPNGPTGHFSFPDPVWAQSLLISSPLSLFYMLWTDNCMTARKLSGKSIYLRGLAFRSLGSKSNPHKRLTNFSYSQQLMHIDEPYFVIHGCRGFSPVQMQMVSDTVLYYGGDVGKDVREGRQKGVVATK